MTNEDVLKFCDKGNHKYKEADVLKSIRPGDISGGENVIYILFQCDECPSKWVKRI